MRSEVANPLGAITQLVRRTDQMSGKDGDSMKSYSVKKLPLQAIALAGTATCLYVLLTLLLFLFSVVMLKRGVIFSNDILRGYQITYYFSGGRNLAPDCYQFDPDLLYEPKYGACKLDNPEYKTMLHFDAYGRIGGVGTRNSNKPGIAVLGDSHAMGFGVDDRETFSAILEEMINRPVYNLGVASYDTYRELLRMEKSGLINRVDTIIIQYCHNDVTTNVRDGLGDRRRFEPADRRSTKAPLFLTIKTWALGAVKIPALKAKVLDRKSVV